MESATLTSTASAAASASVTAIAIRIGVGVAFGVAFAERLSFRKCIRVCDTNSISECAFNRQPRRVQLLSVSASETAIVRQVRPSGALLVVCATALFSSSLPMAESFVLTNCISVGPAISKCVICWTASASLSVSVIITCA